MHQLPSATAVAYCQQHTAAGNKVMCPSDAQLESKRVVNARLHARDACAHVKGFITLFSLQR